jgi:hypothetical protein
MRKVYDIEGEGENVRVFYENQKRSIPSILEELEHYRELSKRNAKSNYIEMVDEINGLKRHIESQADVIANYQAYFKDREYAIR